MTEKQDQAPLLRVRGLRTWFGNGDQPVRAVDGIDLDIEACETYALLGESGCGKSVTALSLMQLLPSAGRIVEGSMQLRGRELMGLSEVQMRKVRGARISMIFQEPMTSLNPVMTIAEQIGESLRLHQGMTRKAQRSRILKLLQEVGIPDPERRLDEYPHQLSGGMKQRVMIAIALATRPELLIADEPTTALDVTTQLQVLDLLKKLQKETGMAILLITHDLGVVSQVADKVAVMYAGEIVETGPAKRFFAEPRHPYSVKLFRSLPSMEKRTARLDTISGIVPPLSEQFPGCRFASRCPLVIDICHDTPVPMRNLPSEQTVRCHLYAGDKVPVYRPQTPLESKATAVPKLAKTLLNVRDLKVHFPIKRGVFRHTVGYVKAVDGVSFDIAKGKTLALVGESGCGKTTVGKGILQLIAPSNGTVKYGEKELTGLSNADMRPLRSDLQFVFQDPFSSLNPRMMVGEILNEGMAAQGVGKGRAERQQRIGELLQQVGLRPDHAQRYPHEFSGGQRQRIAVARALAVNPKLVVCDEPTSALDVSVQAQILNLLNHLQDDLGLAYLFITHNISVVAYLADEVAVMYLGRLVETGPVEEILSRPKHPYTEALLSAVPVVDKATQREVIRLEGDLPSPANPPQGCHFHPRCPKAMEQCKTAYPETRKIGPGHQVSCFLYQ